MCLARSDVIKQPSLYRNDLDDSANSFNNGSVVVPDTVLNLAPV